MISVRRIRWPDVEFREQNVHLDILWDEAPYEIKLPLDYAAYVVSMAERRATTQVRALVEIFSTPPLFEPVPTRTMEWTLSPLGYEVAVVLRRRISVWRLGGPL